MQPFNPSYENYRKILADIKASGKLCDYWEAMDKDEFLILRHDIELSIERAYKLSLIESEEDVCSTYFVQVTNNAYNALSMKNRKMLQDMRDRGHRIGLHYHLCGCTDPVKTRDGVRDQIRILSEMCGFPIDRFSIHRPKPEVYYNRIQIDGVINAYSPEFFTYVEKVEPGVVLDVKYIADSHHRWNYGYPDAETFASNPKIQLLIHPFSWTEVGYEVSGNFKSLLDEARCDRIGDFHDECAVFAQFYEAFLQEVRGD